MNIVLRPDTQKPLEEQLRTGSCSTPDDVVHAALRGLRESDAALLDDSTLDAIDKAEVEIDQGQTRDWSEVREEVRAKFLGK